MMLKPTRGFRGPFVLASVVAASLGANWLLAQTFGIAGTMWAHTGHNGDSCPEVNGFSHCMPNTRILEFRADGTFYNHVVDYTGEHRPLYGYRDGTWKQNGTDIVVNESEHYTLNGDNLLLSSPIPGILLYYKGSLNPSATKPSGPAVPGQSGGTTSLNSSSVKGKTANEPKPIDSFPRANKPTEPQLIDPFAMKVQEPRPIDPFAAKAQEPKPIDPFSGSGAHSASASGANTPNPPSREQHSMDLVDACISVKKARESEHMGFHFTNSCFQTVVIREYVKQLDGVREGGEDCVFPGNGRAPPTSRRWIVAETKLYTGEYLAHAQFVKSCAEEGFLTWPPPPTPFRGP
jgi:hypothetical protein